MWHRWYSNQWRIQDFPERVPILRGCDFVFLKEPTVSWEKFIKMLASWIQKYFILIQNFQNQNMFQEIFNNFASWHTTTPQFYDPIWGHGSKIQSCSKSPKMYDHVILSNFMVHWSKNELLIQKIKVAQNHLQHISAFPLQLQFLIHGHWVKKKQSYVTQSLNI